MFKGLLSFLKIPSHTRTFSVLALLIVIAIIPLTVFIAQQQQETRQRAAVGNCSASNVPNPPSANYKWVPVDNCSRSCTDGTNHSDCPKNVDQPGYVNPDTSNWCYGYEDGAKCLQLKYIGSESGGNCTPIPNPPSANYKWVPVDNCSRSCTDGTNHSDCPKNVDQPGYVNPDTSNWCYGYPASQGGAKCLQLRYTGGGGGPITVSCSENTSLKTSTSITLNVSVSGDKTGYSNIACVKPGGVDHNIGINQTACTYNNLTPGTSYLLKAIATSNSGQPEVQCAGNTYTTSGGTVTQPPGSCNAGTGPFNSNPCYIQLTQPTIGTPTTPWSNIAWIETAVSHATLGFHYDKFWGDYQGARIGWNYAMTGVRVYGGGKGTTQDLNLLVSQMFKKVPGIKTWNDLVAHEQSIGCPMLPIKEACNGNSNETGGCPANASSSTCYSLHNPIYNVCDTMKPPSHTCTQPGTIVAPSVTPTVTSSVTPTITPTIPAGNTIFAFKIQLEGIKANQSIMTPQREISIWLSDTDNNPILDNQKATVNFDPASGLFKGDIDMGNTLTEKKYIIKVKTASFLRAQVPGTEGATGGGIVAINPGVTNQIPTVKLRSGDVNDAVESFNVLDILDFNVLRDCGALDPYPLLMTDPNSQLSSPACQSHAENIRKNTDINDDGIIDTADANLFDINIVRSKGD